MKKILFMVSSMNIGGVEKSLISLLSVIPKDKYNITILTLEKKGGFLEYIPSWVNVEEATWFKNIKPIIIQSPQKTIKKYLRNGELLKIISFVMAYYKSKYSNNRYIYYKNILKSIPANNCKYDVAIAYAGPTEIIDCYITHKVRAKKKISWIHFDVSKFTINKKLYTKVLNKFDTIFVVSNEAKKRLIELVPSIKEKTEIFINIISSNLIKDMSDESVVFDDKYNGTKIVTVGRLSKEKGQDLAIKALSKLKKEGYDCKWYCVGDGSSRKEFEILIKDLKLENDFILLGETVNPYPYIKNADIYVQTSRHEGFCLTLAEAKVLNKPIITTNFISSYEQIDHERNGLISEMSEQSIYENIKYLMDNSRKLNGISKELLHENLDTIEEIYKLIDIIEKC